VLDARAPARVWVAAVTDAHVAWSREQWLRGLKLARLAPARVAGRRRTALETLAVLPQFIALRASRARNDFGLLLERKGANRRLAGDDETSLLLEKSCLIEGIQRELRPVPQAPGLGPC
jgi:hypothetical protein